MTWLAAYSFAKSNWKLLGVLLLILAFLTTCTVLGVKKDQEQAAIVKKYNEDIAAREKAAEDRLADTTKINDNKEKLNEAVASLPDAVPSGRRLALACQRLRNQGLVDLPPECGPAAGGQAPARP